MPRAQSAAASGRGSHLEDVGEQLDGVAHERQRAGEREGAREEDDVPKLDHPLEVVVDCSYSSRSASRRARSADAASPPPRRPRRAEQEGQHGSVAMRRTVSDVERDDPSEPRDVAQLEGDVEERYVAVERLEDEALEHERVLVRALRAVVLKVGEVLGDVAVALVEQRDRHRVDHDGHERQAAVGVKGGAGLAYAETAAE